MEPRKMTSSLDRQSLRLWLHGAGLLGAYTVYGYLQERLMTTTYGDHRLPSSTLLVASNRLLSIITAISIYIYNGHNLRPQQSSIAYGSVSILNFTSTLCQYQALRYVSFTTQSLAKCAKMVPVILMGRLVYNRKYGLADYVAVALVTIGCSLYLFTTDTANDSRAISATKGLSLIVVYLICDGLTSSTQEKLFKKFRVDDEDKGKDDGFAVYDQMLYVNLCSLAISIVTLLLDLTWVPTFYSMIISTSGPRLIFDILVLSASSCIGLVILLNTISQFGALTCAGMMTSRQFSSILINSVVFGTASEIGLLGWMGASYAAVGVWLKMQRMILDLSRPSGRKTLARLVIVPLLTGSILWSIPWASPDVLPSWDSELRQGLGLTDMKACPPPKQRTFYQGLTPRTVLASYPRSGNTHTRTLIEHSTGLYTSSDACDERLGAELSGECEDEHDFLIKTHFPDMSSAYTKYSTNWTNHYQDYDRVLHLIRNPLDCIWSYWHFKHTRYNHTGRVENITQLGEEQREEVEMLTENWIEHVEYWMNVPIIYHQVLYEDLQRPPHRFATLLKVINWLLPTIEDRPSLKDIVCADQGSVAYKSRKAEPFYSWDHYEDTLRDWVLKETRRYWCKLGYEMMLQLETGHEGVNCYALYDEQ